LGKQKAPKPPDPEKTAAAQTKSNIATAVATANLNNVNQTTPFGSLTYEVVGTNADGTPKYQATQSLSAPVQKVVDNTLGAISSPLDLSSSALDAYTNTHYLDDFNKQQDRSLSSLETRLASQGIKMGSEAYTRAMADFEANRGNSYDNFLGSQQSTAKDLLLAGRNQPLNELMALTGKASQPLPTSSTQVAGTDYTSLVNNKYQGDLAAYNQQQSDLFGGLFGLGKAGLGMFEFAPIALSDERLKENITDTGEEVAGVPIKEFDWKGDGRHDMGVMAQDVEKRHPELVDRTNPDGWRRVNYAKLMAKAVEGHRRAA
jgi:hypothetical protein